ncbi:MarR family winged helix-turn-helix transcriptional regulator [Oceaniglobus indicus]|uniref:MarR family winged helix-turn-helix transcriptional regulator n=1 Tax=Oceaniglobus indicus TaxID=2047749 RepID=UPI000C187394|nr:MarR family winged helix-turn-helix transcriptional regulator [Oceaniglobus indicus]
MSNPVSKHATFGMTLRVRDSCLCLHAQRAARAVARRFDEALRPVGLRSGQFSILISLNRPEPPTVGSVADLLAMDRTTLTANLKPLERRGLLRVTPDARDRRARRLTLTDDGLSLLEQAIPIWIATHDEIERRLEGDTDALRQDLNALTKVAGSEPEKRS